MLYKDASQNIKQRFKRTPVCPICGEKILNCENFEYLYFQDKLRRYLFFHTSCCSKSYDNIRKESTNA